MYANFADQRLYRVALSGGGEPTPLTPESDAFPTDALFRFADFQVRA